MTPNEMRELLRTHLRRVGPSFGERFRNWSMERSARRAETKAARARMNSILAKARAEQVRANLSRRVSERRPVYKLRRGFL